MKSNNQIHYSVLGRILNVVICVKLNSVETGTYQKYKFSNCLFGVKIGDTINQFMEEGELRVVEIIEDLNLPLPSKYLLPVGNIPKDIVLTEKLFQNAFNSNVQEFKEWAKLFMPDSIINLKVKNTIKRIVENCLDKDIPLGTILHNVVYELAEDSRQKEPIDPAKFILCYEPVTKSICLTTAPLSVPDNICFLNMKSALTALRVLKDSWIGSILIKEFMKTVSDSSSKEILYLGLR